MYLLVIILIIILFCIGLLLFIVLNKLNQFGKKSTDPTLIEWLKSMQISLQSNSSTLTNVLQENTKQLNERLDKAASVIQGVNTEIGKMTEIGRNMEELNTFLKSPKLRGNLGEQVLKDLINQSFPKNSFSLQYAFKSGQKVDAAIKTDAGILCIDAKFPLENFQKMSKAKTEDEKESSQKDFTRDIKNHIDAIAEKYILPDEGTMDFALMYVPSESVFYEIVNLAPILEYAKQRRVYIVSPSTLYAHLQTILLSFEGRKIETQAKQIFKLLHGLKIDYEKVDESLSVVNKHLTNAANQLTTTQKAVSIMGQKLLSTKDLPEDI
jgi:DNA recombination protein RmuC